MAKPVHRKQSRIDSSIQRICPSPGINKKRAEINPELKRKNKYEAELDRQYPFLQEWSKVVERKAARGPREPPQRQTAGSLPMGIREPKVNGFPDHQGDKLSNSRLPLVVN